MKLIFGLGNSGERYHGTRHNVGSQVVQQLAKGRGGTRWEVDCVRDGFVYGRWPIHHPLARLMDPAGSTMMNESGTPLAEAVKKWKVRCEDILLVCDDVNLPLGVLRLRPHGSDGGHHGLASCLEQLQSQEIPRLRVGVGIQPLPKDLTEFVLSPFHNRERPRLEQVVTRAAEACAVWATDGIQAAMNRVNTRVTKEGAG